MVNTRTFTPRLGNDFVFVLNTGERLPARIVATDVKSASPVVAIVTSLKGVEMLWAADANGEVYKVGRLYDAPVVEERWINIYHGTAGDLHHTRECADGNVSIGRIGLLHFQIIDGLPSNPEFVE